MSISFTASQLISVASCVRLDIAGVSNHATVVVRALDRFERELEHYRSARVKIGLLAEVRLYHRLLIDAINSFESQISV